MFETSGEAAADLGAKGTYMCSPEITLGGGFLIKMDSSQYQPTSGKEGHHSRSEGMCHAGSSRTASWCLLLELVVILCCHPPTSTTPLRGADKGLSCDTLTGTTGQKTLSPVLEQKEVPELEPINPLQQDKSTFPRE